MCLWVIEEVGPVGISLHEAELKKFPQAQNEDLFTDLEEQPKKQHALNTVIRIIIIVCVCVEQAQPQTADIRG